MKKIICCLSLMISCYVVSAQNWSLYGNCVDDFEYKLGTTLPSPSCRSVPNPPKPDFEIIHEGNTMARFEHDFINIAPGSNTKVLIGEPSVTTPNGYKLYVEDGIMTEMVKVAIANSTDWADYVFYKDYDLMTLAEIEIFIKKYNHLPNIPSAHELEKQGLNLGDMQAKQMAKIEELTLHLIQKDKEVKALQKEIQLLKNKDVSSLQKEVELLQKQVALLLAKQ